MGKTHRVQQGETLYSIAHAEGFRGIEAIWDHESNATLRSKRGSPSLLFPGDELHIPDKRVPSFACATRQLHSFRLRRVTRKFEQRLRDERGAPLASMRYELKIDDTELTGRTDGDGYLVHEIAPDARRGRLQVWLREGPDEQIAVWELDLGHLDPVDELSGVQGRLANLGYDPGEVDGQLSEQTKAAITDFQMDHELPATGEPDQATRDKLVAAYGV